ncbi:hypothetical protein BVRB_3g063280 [Beta vulgaris subsp. vulgaris]|nr:hypothetical protein BVRB_3g063280 [Beta vulgaris subsp. vulgaris]
MYVTLSANSISSIPLPVYQSKKAFLLNIAVNCILTLLNNFWNEVEFPMNIEGKLKQRGQIMSCTRLRIVRTPLKKLGQIVLDVDLLIHLLSGQAYPRTSLRW